MKNNIFLLLFLTFTFTTARSQTSTIIYKVCFATSTNKADIKQNKFSNIQETDYFFDTLNHVFRFTSGNFTVLNDALDHKTKLSEIGYKDNYVVAFKDGKRIPLNQPMILYNKKNKGNKDTTKNLRQQDIIDLPDRKIIEKNYQDSLYSPK